jgi:hypothetical protein
MQWLNSKKIVSRGDDYNRALVIGHQQLIIKDYNYKNLKIMKEL